MLASGFDNLVNERANTMKWPRAQMRYNLATLAELRVFRPLPYTPALDGEPWQGEAMLVTIGNGPAYCGGLAVAASRVVAYADGERPGRLPLTVESAPAPAAVSVFGAS